MMKKLVILLAFFSVSMSVFAAPVNINTADAKTIADSLSGIGLKKAEAIIDYRTKNGAFKSVDDLTQVSGIGAKTIEKNKADILLVDSNTPTPAPSSEPITTESVDKVDKTVKKKK
jgi:competence protein ComEA